MFLMLPMGSGIEVFIDNVNTFKLVFIHQRIKWVFSPSLIINFPECLPVANYFCLQTSCHFASPSEWKCFWQRMSLQLYDANEWSPLHASYFTNYLVTCIIMRENVVQEGLMLYLFQVGNIAKCKVGKLVILFCCHLNTDPQFFQHANLIELLHLFLSSLSQLISKCRRIKSWNWNAHLRDYMI